MTKQTLYDKLWQAHTVKQREDGSALIYIDRQLLHEVTSPQAFEGLRLNNRPLWRTQANIATPDHNVSTLASERQAGIEGIVDPVARIQVQTLDDNCHKYQVPYFPINDIRQGIVHVVGPEQGLTLPGMTVVCGDSHTSTHGAFAALAHGIGTSEVEHVLATQCLVAKKMRNMQICIEGELQPGVGAKDVALAVIGKIGTAGGTGYAVEFCGSVVSQLSMEGRMTLCNMAIEAGARVGMIAVDEKTLNYFKGRPSSPKGELWEKAEQYWRTLHSDQGASFDKVITLDGRHIAPQITWGTSPEMVLAVDAKVPTPKEETNLNQRNNIEQALDYMGLEPGSSLTAIKLDRIFIGSCTNSRIEDLRAAAHVLKGKKIARTIKQALVVPGSGLIKEQAEKEGLDKIFIEAGMEWREPGCSMCLAMNADKLGNKEHCASTSNRNFVGRQGFGGRTHLVSPMMAAAASIAGHFVDVRRYL